MVHDLVIFEEVLADVEVALLDFFLGGLDAARDHAALDGLVARHAHALEHVAHPIASEDAHEVVFEGEVKAAGAGIALATSPAANSGFALRSSCLMPKRLSILLSFSDFSTSVVPMSMGRPRRSQ